MVVRSLACLLPLALIAAGPAAKCDSRQAIALSDGGWDYASVDAETGTIFVARTDGIDAIDPATRTVRRLAAANRAHAVLPIPGTTMVLETDGGTDSVRLIDRNSGAVLHSVAVGQKPDAAIWDATRKRAIVINAKSGSISVVDPLTATVTATIQLEPGLEFAALDGRGRLFVNNEETNMLTAVDLDTGKQIANIAMPGCSGPTGLAYAAWADRLVASCETVAAVVDPATMTFVEALPIGTGPDAVILDDEHRRLFVPAGSTGDIAVIESRAGKLTVTRRIASAKSARTGAYDARTYRLYLPSASFAAPVAPAKRGAPVPGSVKLLVLKP